MSTDPTAERAHTVAISAEFRHIIDNLPAFVWCAAPDGSIAFLNRRGLEYTGFSLDQVAGWNWRDTTILHADDMEALFQAWQAIVASRREGEIQARMRRFDGEYRWFLFRVAPQFDETGELTAWWGVDVEIDERKRAEDQVRHALTQAQAVKDQFELVIDTIPGLVWSSLPDGNIDFLNQRWREYTGLSLHDASGWGWRVAIHPDDLPGLESYWRSILSSGQPGEYEARLRRFDGTYRWFLFRGVPLFNAAGTLVKWYGQNTDIEDRKRAEALLTGEKRLLEMMTRGAALPSILEAVCVLVENSAPGCLCSILLVDPTGTRLHHGAAPSLPSSYNDAIHGRAIHPDAGPCGMAAFVKEQVIVIDTTCDARWAACEWDALAVRHGLRGCWSTPITSSDGVVLGTFALYWRRPGGPEGEHQTLIERMTHLAAVAIDRKRSEDALNQVRSDLAHVARVATLGEMSASIAHEINQPLGAIVNNASAGLRWLSANAMDDARASMALVVADGHRASEILHRIRVMVQKSPTHTQPVDLNDAVLEVLTLVGSQAAKHAVSIESRLSDGMPPVQADRVQVQQVVLNLIMNAIESMSDTPPALRRITIATTRDDDATVHVSVRDQGAGFGSEQSARLFEAFYSTKPDGLGMGLAISRGIVQSHHGQLWATANAEGGATFQFTLPVAQVGS